LAEIEDTESDHEAGADDARAGSIYAKAGEPAEGQHQINGEKDEDGRQETSLLHALRLKHGNRTDLMRRKSLGENRFLTVAAR
jgi:hypothetical protein